jgi:glycosyltransferase involved in cell wall biosynthesis
VRLFDSRWEGPHGIGRFAFEVGRRLEKFERVSLSGSPSSPFDPFKLAWYLRSVKPSLFVSPGYNAPIGVPCPFVVCVHDLNHIVMSEYSSPLKRAYYQYVLKPALHHAEVVLTVSEFARRSICDWAEIPDSKVCNVGNGISDAFVFAPSSEVDQESRYFLYVGNHKPHKNFERLLKAFSLARVSDSCSLVSTGTPTKELLQVVAQLGLTGRVRFVGQVSDGALAELYRGATALILVSLYEGFGLPLVEGMACGTPVVTSNRASMPEVIGDAGMQVDPLDTEGIAEAITRLALDDDLRKGMSARGVARARLFSWDITGRRVAEALAACG